MTELTQEQKDEARVKLKGEHLRSSFTKQQERFEQALLKGYTLKVVQDMWEELQAWSQELGEPLREDLAELWERRLEDEAKRATQEAEESVFRYVQTFSVSISFTSAEDRNAWLESIGVLTSSQNQDISLAIVENSPREDQG